MSDINSSFDESIAFLNIRNHEIDQSSFLLNVWSDENKNKFREFLDLNFNENHRFNYKQMVHKLIKSRLTLVKHGDVLLVRDGNYTCLEMKFISQHKPITLIDLESISLESIDLSSGSNSLELLFSKLASSIEITTPKTWNNISFYFHDIVEDHRENLIPDCRRKYRIEWLANCITIWRLLLFLGYFVLRLVKEIMSFRRSSL